MNLVDYWQTMPLYSRDEQWNAWDKAADAIAHNAGYTGHTDPTVPRGYLLYMFSAADRAVTADIDGTEYVNVYEVDRAPGGAEEGGWWFDTGQAIESRHVMRADVERVEQELTEKYPRTGNSSSVIYRGGDYRVYVEDAPAQDFPEYAPHYE